MLNMVVCKTGHGKIAVIITFRISDIESRAHAGFLGSFCKVLGQELTLFIKIVASTLTTVSEDVRNGKKGTYHIDQYIKGLFPCFHQFGSIMLLALGLPVLFSKIALECLLPPWSFQGVCDWCKRATALIFSRVLQE
jgi:hypothetical protein